MKITELEEGFEYSRLDFIKSFNALSELTPDEIIDPTSEDFNDLTKEINQQIYMYPIPSNEIYPEEFQFVSGIAEIDCNKYVAFGHLGVSDDSTIEYVFDLIHVFYGD